MHHRLFSSVSSPCRGHFLLLATALLLIINCAELSHAAPHARRPGKAPVSCAEPSLDVILTELRALQEANRQLHDEVSRLRHDQQTLQDQLVEAEGRLAVPVQAPPPVDCPISDLEKELADAVSGVIPEGAKTTAQTSLGMSGATNPDIGAVGIIVYTDAERDAEPGDLANTRTFASEAEFIVSGYVDPFHKYDLILHFCDDGVEVEEGFLTRFGLPMHLFGRIGVFRSAMGFINQHHLDELPWAGDHVFLDSYLGEGGLVTNGFELERTLAPHGLWTPTLSVEVGLGHDFDGTDPNNLIGDPNPLAPWRLHTHARDLRVLGRLRNHFHLSPTRDVMLGGSYLTSERGAVDVVGVDMQFRHRPRGYQGLTILGEYLQRRDDDFTRERDQKALGRLNPRGYMVNAEYQWNKQWRAGLVHSSFDATYRPEAGRSRSNIGYIAYSTTEFSRYLLQYEDRRIAGVPDDKRLTLQLIFNVGYHRHKLK